MILSKLNTGQSAVYKDIPIVNNRSSTVEIVEDDKS